MVDDNPWSKPVVDAQDGGKRHINCFVPGGPSRTDVETAAREYQREYGYARVEAGSIVSRKPRKGHSNRHQSTWFVHAISLEHLTRQAAPQAPQSLSAAAGLLEGQP